MISESKQKLNIGGVCMVAAESRFLPRLIRFWLLHFGLALVGGLIMYVGSYLQSAGATLLAPVVVLIFSVGFTILYYMLMKQLARHLLNDRAEGRLFAIAGSIPFFILIAVSFYLRAEIPYNSIPAGLVLVPVTLPFQGWIETVFPLLSMQVLALSVPLVFMGSILAGTAMKPR